MNQSLLYGAASLPEKPVHGSPFASLSDRWFELLLITIVLLVTTVAHALIGTNMIVVHFFYLPVIIAAHYFGRSLACTTALLSVLLVSTFVMIDPERYMGSIDSTIMLMFHILAWGSFLGITALLMGTLSNQRSKALVEVREAHIGIIEILSKYLSSADLYTKSHSMRVSELSVAIAEKMRLKPSLIEDIRVGALLHDIGKIEISTKLIKKAAALDEDERAEVDAHTVQGADLVRSLGTILDSAIPVIQHHHDHYSADSKHDGLHGDEIPIGARVVSVADAYDAIITDRPYRRGRTPEEAVAIIRQAAGTQFDPAVVSAFERVITLQVNDLEDEVDIAAAHERERVPVG